MSSNKLVLSVVLSLSVLSLTACKKGGDNSRTQIRKGKPSANSGRTKPEAAKPGDTGTATTKPNDPNAPADVAGDSGKGVTIRSEETNLTAAECKHLEAAAKEHGWEMKSIETEDKVKVVYYVMTASLKSMNNPVIYFNRNALQITRSEDLKRFAKIHTDYKIDPILMDMRGAGCSSALPDLKTKAAELNKYGSRAAVADAEKIRKAVLKDEKWKVMANLTGGAVALRYAQLAPQGVTSIHIADFAPMKSQTELMKLRGLKEVANLKEILKAAKLEEEVVQKAIKKLEAEKNCTGLKSCASLIDLLGGLNMSQKAQWSQIATRIQAIADGKLKAQDLMKELELKKQHLDKVTISRILDLDSNKNLTACADAVKGQEKSLINSCRLEVAIGHGETKELKNLNHDALNMQTIKTNLTNSKIDYHLFAGEQSVMFPKDAYEDHQKDMESILGDNFNLIPDAGSEVHEDEKFLNTLKN